MNIIDKIKSILNQKYLVPMFALIIIFSIFIMLINGLGSIDSGLHCDEAGIGINAFFLSETLHDETNNFLPLFIKNFVSYKMPVYVYLTSIIVKIIGLSAFSVRLLAVICGAFTAFFLYLLARRYFNNFTTISSLIFLGLCPGFFHIQRIAFELTSFSCFFLGFLYFLTLRTDKKSNYYLIPAFIFFILAWYSYIPTQIFMVSILFLMLIFNIKSLKTLNKNIIKKNKVAISSIAIGFILFIIIPYILILPELLSTIHVSNKFLLSNLNPENSIQATLDYLKKHYNYYYNHIVDLPRYLQLAIISLINWIESYSINFLFFVGDGEIRHIASKFGPLPLVFLFLLPTGLIVCINNFKEQHYKLLIAAFISIGMPSAMIVTPLELTHNSHMYPFMALIAALGFNYIITQFIKPLPIKLIATILIGILTIIPFYKYHHTYFNKYRFESDKAWYAHRDEIFYYIRGNHLKYKKVYFSNQIHELFAHLIFYAIQTGEFNVKQYQENKTYPFNMEPLRHDLYSPNTQIESIKNLYGENALYVLNPEELVEVENIEVVKYNDGSPVATFKEIK